MSSQSTIRIYHLSDVEAWTEAGRVLRAKVAAASPTPIVGGPYSQSVEEEVARTQRVMKNEQQFAHVIQFQMAVIYEGVLLSMVLTCEANGDWPGQMHMSITRLNPIPTSNEDRYLLPSDEHCRLAASALLLHYEERQEGVLKNVRHFREKKITD